MAFIFNTNFSCIIDNYIKFNYQSWRYEWFLHVKMIFNHGVSEVSPLLEALQFPSRYRLSVSHSQNASKFYLITALTRGRERIHTKHVPASVATLIIITDTHSRTFFPSFPGANPFSRIITHAFLLNCFFSVCVVFTLILTTFSSFSTWFLFFIFFLFLFFR